MEMDDDAIDVDDGDLDEQALRGANVLMLSSGHPDHHRHSDASGDGSGEEEAVGTGQGGVGMEDGGDGSGQTGGKKKKRKFRFHTKRSQPVGADAHAETNVVKPQRIFKVVFVGDSGVGKSSFIHRFCHQEFRPNFAATIGVDFQIKTMDSRNTTCILQLWDTAGQERYRSLTNAYFRKADGVIVMYDVTSEKSFMSVRNWMGCVQTQVEPGTVIALLGNKLDVTEDDSHRPVKEKDGMLLADEYEAIFYETSAKSGANIQEAMEAFTSWLQEKEDKRMEDGLKLVETPNKKGCCGR